MRGARAVRALIAVAVAATLGVVAVPRILAAREAAEPRLEYDSPHLASDGLFRVVLPCLPRWSEAEVPLDGGRTGTLSSVVCEGAGLRVTVSAGPLRGVEPTSAAVAASLRTAATSAAARRDARISEYHELTHDGLSAASAVLQTDGTVVRTLFVVGGASVGPLSIVSATIVSSDGDPSADFDELVGSLRIAA